MTARNVVFYPDPDLRAPNRPVTEFNAELETLTSDMLETMYAHDGIGLAAPQIGVHQNVVVIDIPEEDGSQGKHQLILINPRITELAGEEVESEEGCLSVPEYRDKVTRHSICSVSYQDLEGKEQSIEKAEGLLAICLQHELDHLQGKVFVDYLSRLKRSRLQKKYAKLLQDKH
ncbi:MAG: peptide deformylase [Succinivibrio sp.]|nr:peptide deformylase [Succinivibrio sp.]